MASTRLRRGTCLIRFRLGLVDLWLTQEALLCCGSQVPSLKQAKGGH